MQQKMSSCFAIYSSYIYIYILKKNVSKKQKNIIYDIIIYEINLFRNKQGSLMKLIKISVLISPTTANLEKRSSVLTLLLTKL